MNISITLLLLGIGVASAMAGESKLGNQRGMASWYGSECSKTASGEHYNPGSLTAAHRTLPFGTMVEVRSVNTGRSVTVRINNRGPFCKGRIIDLSKAAAEQLHMVGSGVATVELMVVK